MKKNVILVILSLLSLFIFAEENNSYTPQEKFFIEYSAAQEQTQHRLVLMNKKSNLKKLGEEQIDGLVSGTLHYKTKVSGFSAVITLTYDNYSDDGEWYFNGQIITKSNMSASGTLDGEVKVDGKGTVKYDKVILTDGKSGGGVYQVCTETEPFQDVDYSLYFVAVPEILKK